MYSLIDWFGIVLVLVMFFPVVMTLGLVFLDLLRKK